MSVVQLKNKLAFARRSTLAVVACAIALAGCSGPGGASSQSTNGSTGADLPFFYPAGKGTDQQIDVLKWGILDGAPSVDPIALANTLMQAFLEPLVKVNHRGEMETVLAESIDRTSPMTIDVKLRQGVTFWDGSPLTVDDVIYSIDHTIAPDSRLHALFAAVKSASQTGPDSLQIKLAHPQADILRLLARLWIIQKKHAIAAGDTLGTGKGLVMGTGAYEIKEFVPETRAKLVQYENYWGAKPSAKEVDIQVFSDEQALRLAVQSGAIDGTMEVPVADASEWAKIANVNVGIAAGADPDCFLILDTTQPPFNDIHARRAMAALVDRAGIVAAAYGGNATPLRSVSPPMKWTDMISSKEEIDKFMAGLPLPEYSPKLAAEELAKSATPGGFSVTILVPQELTAYATVAQILQKSAAGIGVNITVKRVSSGEWLDSYSTKSRRPLSILGLGTPAGPMNIPAALVQPVPNRWSSYNTPSIQTAINEYNASTDPAAQAKYAKAALTELAEQLPFIPISSSAVAFALNKDYVLSDGYSSNKSSSGNNWAASVKIAAK